MDNCIEFDCGPEGIKDMAIFCAQLQREGIRFKTTMRGGTYIVTLIGF